ncbi:TrbI/VirB10 family protein [Niveispirillum sp. KHB5.9]|uniref:TrbI/VirB10 family protein n=1 Tax=Niveispirillum sp. KHB5.9 TaxID=3400269 RepID=UPI003A8C3BB7
MSGAAPMEPVDLRLRPAPPRVVRLSRRVVVLAALVAGLTLGAILVMTLRERRQEILPNRHNIDSHATADGIAGLPRDYGDAPRLGPPLPGDLGRPLLALQQGVQADGAPAMPLPDPRQQPLIQEQEAARMSRLFVGGNSRSQETTRPEQTASAISDGGSAAPTQAPDRQQAFLDAPVDQQVVSRERLADPPSPYLLQAGAIIPAALITRIRSDLPGQVTAQVTENVHDSLTGRHLLIPQGARLVGLYDNQVAFGQSRLLLTWTRLILPDGRSLLLEGLPGTDPQGQAGLGDDTDYHWGGLFKAALLSTLLSIGTEAGADDEESALVRALRRGGQDTVSQTGQEIVRRQLGIQPTLTIRPGFPVKVMVTRDLVLEPLIANRISRHSASRVDTVP